MKYTKIKGKYYKVEKEINNTEVIKELERRIEQIDKTLALRLKEAKDGFARQKTELQSQLDELNKLN